MVDNRDVKVEIEYSDGDIIDKNDFDVLCTALLDYYLRNKENKIVVDNYICKI